MSTDRNFRLIATQSDTHTPQDYNKIRVGRTVLGNDAFLNLDYLKPKQRRIKRSDVERALDRQD